MVQAKCDLVLSFGTGNVFIEERRRGDYHVRSLNHILSKIFAPIFERPFDSSNRSLISIKPNWSRKIIPN